MLILEIPKTLWSTVPAPYNNIIRTAYPLGNGRLGALSFGPAGHEALSLNLDSLWSGGPFETSNYTGGNPTSPVPAEALQEIRSNIFQNGTGGVDALLGNDGYYGSYRVLGNLSVALSGFAENGTSVVDGYKRSLDLDTGIHTTEFTRNGMKFETKVFCSFPDQVCVYSVSSSGSLPTLEIKLDNELAEAGLQNVTSGEGFLRLRGVTQRGPPEGMQYDAIARVVSGTNFRAIPNEETGTLTITPGNATKSIAIVVGAGTNYDAKKGTAEHNYSFRGEDPGSEVEKIVEAAASKTFIALQEAHEMDFTSLTTRFILSLPDPLNSTNVETAELISRYNATSAAGDPYLESLLFAYANYLFISSSRPGSLPPNLQGRWSEGLGAAWSGDYHANINLQMNHWTADQTGLTDLQSPLWDYMADTWVPRGEESAKLLYGSVKGWVVHNEMNIFGHTGMKSGAEWANYPAAAAWVMQHVFDHWEYSQDEAWLRDQGYPLIKGVAEFWLDQLQEDAFTRDGTLVVNPCNSPEHGPTTFGCVHYHQLIHQVFEAALSTASAAGETEAEFLSNVTKSLEKLDKGFHIGEWGQIKEWKLPDSYGLETQNDTHRHLSELVGWYPGYSLSSFLSGYANTTIQSAIEQKLYSRGIGKGPDANAGWAKVWRSACWARLNNTERAYFELRYAIDQNFVANGFSMYSGTGTPFQIDANYGLGGAVLSMLVVDLPAAVGDDRVRTVVIGPAIPEAWGGGSVKGLRLRGGGVVDFEWDEKGLVTKAQVNERKASLRIVDKEGRILA
ncbi:glycoside hydrolase family 95 protein-like protein [Byssothecium circinans]|uniref:Glycoside hydrolase family 95 protein-like protein n=1 Tax=Byssothecium circinans TaxID=147558 RepID=A0A6A5TDB5_9PLEO|nr:glycoside hydrolase family 95 protein-like protein [Byssothecium circinans]